MTRYFKKSYKHNTIHHSNTDSHHPNTNYCNITHSHKHKFKFQNISDQVNEIIGQTHVSINTKSEPEDIKDTHDSDSLDSNLDSSSDSE